MSAYSDGEFEKRLANLKDSQKEIQSISTWLVHHRKLTFMYLANDVVQNSRRKGPEYVKEYAIILQKIFHHLASLNLEEKTKQSLGRLINIWGERQIFEKTLLQSVEKLWSQKTKSSLDTSSDSIKSSTPRRKSSGPSSAQIDAERRKSDIDIDEMLESPLRKLNQSQNLENAASSDAEVREKIAKLPPEVSEIAKLETITSATQGKALLVQVEEASSLLKDYNARLQEELKERKRVGNMVSEFLSAQRELLAQAEERLEQYYEKLEKMKNMEADLKSHIEALPDIPVLPSSGGGGLDSLPRGGDLFR